MTVEDSQLAAVRLEILSAGSYARAGAYVDASPPQALEPAKIRIERGPVPISPPVVEASAPAADATDEQPVGRPPHYPLRRRGLRIREAGHTAYHDAETPWGGVVAAYDYARSADARAAKGGMYLQPAEETLIDIGRALMAMGDLITTAMHTWRPES